MQTNGIERRQKFLQASVSNMAGNVAGGLNVRLHRPASVCDASESAPSVRCATLQDLPALFALFQRAGAGMRAENRNVDLATLQELSESGTFIVLDGGLKNGAASTGAVIGALYFQRDGRQESFVSEAFLAIGTETGISPDAAEPRFVLSMLAVDPDSQSHGVGTRLVRVAEALAESMGYRAVCADLCAPQEDLTHWYTHRGYVQVGQLLHKSL